MAGFTNRGLWLPGSRIEVQPVKKSHRLPCLYCEEVPEGRRLQVREGSGRGASGYVLCSSCGAEWIDHLCNEGRRAIALLGGAEIADDDGNAVRMDHDIREALRERARQARQKAKDKKDAQDS